jgi:hypothetical protein
VSHDDPADDGPELLQLRKHEGRGRASAAPVKICHIVIRPPCYSAPYLDLLMKGAIDLPTLDGGN